MPDTTINLIDLIGTIILGIAGLLISWAVYQQTNQRARETWLRTFASIHEAFWDDPDIHEVRCWLAYPRAYETLRTVLLKRQALSDEAQDVPDLEREEFLMLDKLDKYLNTLLRVITINPEVSKHRDLWNALHFKYWLNACLDLRRPELNWYVKKFYGRCMGVRTIT